MPSRNKLGVYNLILKRMEHGWERLVGSSTGAHLPGGTPGSSGHTTQGLGDTPCGMRSHFEGGSLAPIR